MAPFALAMRGVLNIQAAGLRPQTMAGLALCHRLAFLPDGAPSLVVVMALGAGHSRASCTRWLNCTGGLCRAPEYGDFQETNRRASVRELPQAPRRPITPKISPAT